MNITFRRSKRVSLRPVLRSDIPRITAWINDPEVTQYLRVYLPMMETDEEKWFEKLGERKQDNIVLVIEIYETDSIKRPIGITGIHNINWKDRTAITGTMIGAKDFWGKGYGTEAKMLLLDYAFNTLNLRKMCSSVFEFNKRSLAYSLKCGYYEEGRLRRQVYVKGRYWDEIMIAVFKEDFLKLQRKLKKDAQKGT